MLIFVVERIVGGGGAREVTGVRWLLSEKRREGSLVVVYLRREVLLGPEACFKMLGKRQRVCCVFRLY